MAVLYTIGHATRTLGELLALVKAHSIELLVDLRSFPGSRRWPHFNRAWLEKALPEAGVRYLGMKNWADCGRRSVTIRLTSRWPAQASAITPTTC